MKKQFINDEIWILVFGGAFQRANIYKNDVPDLEKQYFRIKIKGYVQNLVKTSYKGTTASDSEHIENIMAFEEFTTSFKRILKGGKLNFGVCQKILNLHLKYQWCLGHIEEPPHFPVDRIIQQRLRCNPVVAWTQMTSYKDYMNVIEKARKELNGDSTSLAQLELNLFNRRIDSN